jgi:hypothetical protein
MDATVTRLAMWYEKLNCLIGSGLGIPQKENGNIVVRFSHD